MFVDVEAAMRSWFRAGGITAPMSTKKPRGDKAVAWLQIVRIGGPTETLVTEAAQIELSAYGDNETTAIALLNQARALLRPSALTGQAPFFHADEYGGPVNLPDPTLPEQARYTANYTVRTRF